MTSGDLRRKLKAVVALFIATLLVPAELLATDNLGFHWVPQQWSIYNYSPCYVFESDFPTGAARSRVSDARMKWNNTNTEFWIGLRTPCTYPSMKSIIVKWDDLWAPFNENWAFVTCNFPSISNCALNVNSSPDVAGFQHLNHTTQCTCDRMWPYQNLGEVKRNLTSHDVASIRAMYPYPAQ
jgi:hypothetical protein